MWTSCDACSPCAVIQHSLGLQACTELKNMNAKNKKIKNIGGGGVPLPMPEVGREKGLLTEAARAAVGDAVPLTPLSRDPPIIMLGLRRARAPFILSGTALMVPAPQAAALMWEAQPKQALQQALSCILWSRSVSLGQLPQHAAAGVCCSMRQEGSMKTRCTHHVTLDS